MPASCPIERCGVLHISTYLCFTDVCAQETHAAYNHCSLFGMVEWGRTQYARSAQEVRNPHSATKKNFFFLPLPPRARAKSTPSHPVFSRFFRSRYKNFLITRFPLENQRIPYCTVRALQIVFEHTCDPTVESNRLAQSKESREKGKEKRKKLGTVRLRRYLFPTPP